MENSARFNREVWISPIGFGNFITMQFSRFLALLYFYCCPCAAQLPASFTVMQYDEANSGISGNVTCFLQAEDGYLWLGSSNGLLRFDGYSFKTYANKLGFSNTINHLAEDKDHNIWMSFVSGALAWFNPKNGKFTNVTFHSDLDSSISTGEVTALFFDHANQLWVGMAQKGLLKVNSAGTVNQVYPVVDIKKPVYAPSLQKVYNTVYAMSEDETHTLWLATHNGLYTFSKAHAAPEPVREKPLKTNAFRTDLFRTITLDGDSLWLGSWAGGLSCYNKKTNRWRNHIFDAPNFKTYTSNIITGVAKKDKTALWIASPDKGLGIFDKKTSVFYFFSNNKQYPNIPGEEWTELITDKDDNVWAIQQEALLKIRQRENKFPFHPVPVLRSDNHVHYEISDIWENEKVKLTATSFADGLHVYTKQTGKTVRLPVAVHPKEEQFMDIRQLYQDSHGRLFVLSRDYIYEYKNNKLVKSEQPPLYTKDSLSNNFVQLAEDKTGALWIASRRNGIFIWSTLKNRFLHLANTSDADYPLPTNNIRSLSCDGKGRMWIASSDGLLGFVDVFTKKVVALPVGYGTLKKMPGNKAYALQTDTRGNIWAGTTSGLYYFDCLGETPQLQKVFRSTEGLHSDLVYDIQEDKTGNIWCLSDAALCLIANGDSLITAFDRSDGIKKGRDARIVRTLSDTMLLASYGGYYAFAPADFSTPTNVYPMRITGMQVNDKPFYFEEALAKDKTVFLKPNQNYFSFEFAALDYKHPEKEHYTYMLEGFDKAWIFSGNRRYVSYTNMSGGDYVFKVKGSTDKTFTKASEIQIAIHVGTPFYKQPWFYILLFAVAFGTLYWFYKARIRYHQQMHQLQSKAQLLEKEKALVMYESLKQQLNPHFLFNSLTSLNSLIVWEPQKAKQFLEQMSKIYRYILKSNNSELVPLADEIKFVETYIKLQKTRFGDGLQVTMSVADSDRTCKIVPVTLQNLFENAIKHNSTDKETPLCIHVESENGYVVVRNNLQKRGLVETSNKQGLHNMKTLYRYLTDKPFLIQEDEAFFTVKIPLIE